MENPDAKLRSKIWHLMQPGSLAKLHADFEKAFYELHVSWCFQNHLKTERFGWNGDLGVRHQFEKWKCLCADLKSRAYAS